MNNTLDIESLDWKKSGGLLPGHHPGRRQRGRADAGLHEPRGAAGDTHPSPGGLLQPHPRQALGKRRDLGQYAGVVSIAADCDSDALLVRVHPQGPTCHRNTPTCFGDGAPPRAEGLGFLAQLETVITSRIAQSPEGSYTAKLYGQGIKRMAQKVGEEGVEVALAAQAGDNRELVSEAADLVFHLALLLRARDLSLDAVGAELAARHNARKPAR